MLQILMIFAPRLSLTCVFDQRDSIKRRLHYTHTRRRSDESTHTPPRDKRTTETMTYCRHVEQQRRFKALYSNQFVFLLLLWSLGSSAHVCQFKRRNSIITAHRRRRESPHDRRHRRHRHRNFPSFSASCASCASWVWRTRIALALRADGVPRARAGALLLLRRRCRLRRRLRHVRRDVGKEVWAGLRRSRRRRVENRDGRNEDADDPAETERKKKQSGFQFLPWAGYSTLGGKITLGRDYHSLGWIIILGRDYHSWSG